MMRMTLEVLVASSLYAQAAVGPVKPLPDDLLPRVSSVIDAVYRLDYARAEQLCRQLIDDAPENPTGYVYLLRVYWSEQLSQARLLSAERVISMDLFSQTPKFRPVVSPQVLERLNSTASIAVAKSAEWAKQNPNDLTARYLLGTAYEFKATYQFTAAHSLADSTASANRAYKIHHELAQKYQMADAGVTEGVYSIVADSLDWFPKLVGWFLFGIRGNLNEGRLALERAAERGSIEVPDARLALAIIYTRQKRFDDAKARLQELLRDYPENYLVHLDIASVDLLADRPAQAIRTYRDILSRNYSQLNRGIALTRLGVASRVVGDMQESERWLREAVQDSSASGGSRSVARVELGKTLDLEGQRESAVEQYRAALRAPDFLALHEDAERLIKKPYDLNALRQDNAAGGLVTLR